MYFRSFLNMMMILWCGAVAAQPEDSLTSSRKILKLMGTRFELIALAENDSLSWNAINAGIAEIERIENLISSWNPSSQTSSINRNAGIKPVTVSSELFQLIQRSIKVSRLTNGVFDISYASMDNVWRYDGSMTELPSAKEMAVSVSKIGYTNIVLNAGTKSVFLRDAGMKIGFGAIGKGYAANRAREVMKQLGIENGVVNAAGDLFAWGKQADGKDWRISIADPNDSKKVLCWLTIRNQAVVTSGNYEKFVEIDGVRYGHIIHPKTGMPVSGLKSATIICPDAELADALATSVFILGKVEGLALVNRLKQVECLLIDAQNEVHTSKNLKVELETTAP
ncbi:MAG: FAD:protein FMN transferase [Calditrichia bacterium]